MQNLNQKSYTIKNLPKNIKENLLKTKMDSRHDYLNELMEDINIKGK